MASQRALTRLKRLTEEERAREAHVLQRLLSGEALDATEVLGSPLAHETSVYPAGLILDDFLPLALALSETVLIRVPALFSVAEYEEVIGLAYADFLSLIDRGLVTPILNDYSLYQDPDVVVPIVNEKRAHLTEQRVLLNLIAGDSHAWEALVAGLQAASELFPSRALHVEDQGDDVQFQGIHVAYATLCAVGYGETVKEVTCEYIRHPESELFESVRRLVGHPDPTQEEVAFVLTTFLSGFFADCVGLGATGQFDDSYERVLRIPEVLSGRVAFLPTAFGRRLVEWLDLALPRRLATADLDHMLDSDARRTIAQATAQFKRNVEAADFTTAADEGLTIRETLGELDRAYRRMSSIKKYGSLLSSVSFAAVPLTLAAGVGLTEGIASGATSVAAKVALAQVEADDLLAQRVFNPLLARLSPWRMSATTYQLCKLRTRVA